MDKIFSVYSYRETTMDGVSAEYLDLPAMPYELLDTLEKARPEEGGTAQFFVEEIYSFDFLSKHLEGKYNLPELNALAEKLTELDERQTTGLAGLVQMDEAKQSGPIGLPRLIDLAYSTDRCHVVDEALNDTQLGRFCAENGFCPGLDELPDEVFDLLDFERIGREFRREQGGVLVERTADHPGGYVQRHDELRQVYKTLDFRLKKPNYHKLRLHGEPILKQMILDLQSVRERRMLWSLDIIELNKRISDINDQDRMLADMNKCGLVDPDIFIARSNLLAQQLRAAKQEKERILGAEQDDSIPKTRELMELIESMPEFLPDFDGEIFTDLVAGITAEAGNVLRFRLKNNLELTEIIERSRR